MKKETEVSVIVACYNPNWKKLKATLKSIIAQEDIKFEIIISDDGSEYCCDDKIRELFALYCFENYSVVKNNSNRGTVKNFIEGLKISKGEYVKFISPGDCLFDSNTLSEWYKYNKTNNIKVSFGDYHSYLSNDLSPISTYACPQLPSLFKNTYNNELKFDYLLFNDAILGACLLSDRQFTNEYLCEIEDCCKYAEDQIYRLMIARKEPIVYFNRSVIWYEQGEGITSSQNIKWKEIIKQEINAVEQKMLENNKLSKFDNFRLSIVYKHKFRVIKYILFPESILLALIKHKSTRYTCADLSNEHLKEFFGDDENASN